MTPEEQRRMHDEWIAQKRHDPMYQAKKVEEVARYLMQADVRLERRGDLTVRDLEYVRGKARDFRRVGRDITIISVEGREHVEQVHHILTRALGLVDDPKLSVLIDKIIDILIEGLVLLPVVPVEPLTEAMIDSAIDWDAIFADLLGGAA